MKTLVALSVSMIIALAVGTTVSGSASTTKLPATIRSALDRSFPGWKFAIPDENMLQDFIGEPNFSPEQLCVLTGDFDGNNQPDWAVNVIVPGSANRAQRLIVYLRHGKHYWRRTVVATDVDTQAYIQLRRRGEQGFDFGHDRNFRYPLDSVFLGYGGRSGASYVWRRGRFVGIVTAD